MVKLFVGQIPKTWEEESIRPVMEEYGTVKDIKIIRDKVTNAHRGMAYLVITNTLRYLNNKSEYKEKE